jgi:hypothetical protein
VTGTTVTIGRTGQNVAHPGTVSVTGTADIAVIDRAGTIGIGTTSGTTITVGRSGQTQALAGNATVAGTLGVTGTADIAVVDRAGTIGIGTTNGTTVTLGRTGQTVSFPGIVSVTATEDFYSSITAGTNWSITSGAARRVVGLVTLQLTITSTGAGSWAAVGTIPAGYRPLALWTTYGYLFDQSASQNFGAVVQISTAGNISVAYYDLNTGTGLSASPPAPATSDLLIFSTAYPVV